MLAKSKCADLVVRLLHGRPSFRHFRQRRTSPRGSYSLDDSARRRSARRRAALRRSRPGTGRRVPAALRVEFQERGDDGAAHSRRMAFVNGASVSSRRCRTSGCTPTLWKAPRGTCLPGGRRHSTSEGRLEVVLQRGRRSIEPPPGPAQLAHAGRALIENTIIWRSVGPRPSASW